MVDVQAAEFSVVMESYGCRRPTPAVCSIRLTNIPLLVESKREDSFFTFPEIYMRTSAKSRPARRSQL